MIRLLLIVSTILPLGWVHAEPTAARATAGRAAPDLSAISARRDAQVRTAPRWVRRLAARPIERYAPLATLVDADALRRGRAEFLKDARRLLNHFESDADFRAMVDRRLVRVAATMSYRTLSRRVAIAPGVKQPVGALTLEQMIAREEFRALGGEPNPLARAWALVTGPHLRGATPDALIGVWTGVAAWAGRIARHQRIAQLRKFAPVAAVVGTSALTLWAVEHFGQTHFLTGFFLGAVQVGILGPLVSAATGWLVTPSTEYLKVWNSRFTGEAEQAINQFFDRFKPRLAAEDSYDQVRIATVADDGGDAAGMTAAQQLGAWDKILRLCNGVPKTYNRLLRHSQHHGRALITALWSDEVQTATAAQQFEKNSIDLRTNDEAMLGPYRAALIARGEFAQNDRLTAAYLDLIDHLTRQPWNDLNPARADRAFLRAHRTATRLKEEFGIADYVIERLIENQRRNAEMTAVLIATLAVNELRYLFYAEANRNMEEETREVQRQIRRSLLIQRLVERYQPEIQAIHRKMGFANGPCEGALAA